jgi:hypothetical protein
LWHNQQTEVCFVLRPKPRNHRGDFEAQITKPELSVLRPKPGNPPPLWFWGSTKKPTTGFEAKSEEIIATSFEAKQEKTVATDFETKPAKTVAVGFEAKPLEIVATGFETKPAKTCPSGFEVNPLTNHRPWFWGSTKKPVLLVSMCQVRTTHGAARPLDHPATEYPTCATIPGPLHQVSYSCHGPRRCTPCRTYHLHTTRQANVILQWKKDKRKIKWKLSRIRIQTSSSQ